MATNEYPTYEFTPFTFPDPSCPRCDGMQLDPDAMYCPYCLEKMALWRLAETNNQPDGDRNG